jgi:hypothetical protein
VWWGPTDDLTSGGGLDGDDAAEAVRGAEIVLGGPWIRSNCLTQFIWALLPDVKRNDGGKDDSIGI